jgi:hypothetical protein
MLFQNDGIPIRYKPQKSFLELTSMLVIRIHEIILVIRLQRCNSYGIYSTQTKNKPISNIYNLSFIDFDDFMV